jgi:thiol-disulfide isomerase/thioredoxin
MKKILALLAMTASLLMAELEWAESYDAALETASKEGKLVMVMFSSEGCPACEYMKDIVFDDDDVMDELHMGFVPVELDIHNDMLPSGLGYIGTPTFHFLTPQEQKVGRLDGGANVMDFTTKMREVKKTVRNR